MTDSQNRGRRRPIQECAGDSQGSLSPGEGPTKKYYKCDTGDPQGSRQKSGGGFPYSKDPSGSSTSVAGRECSLASKAPPEGTVRRRQRYEIVHTKPQAVGSKKGTLGQPIQLLTNCFRIQTPKVWQIYQYHVTFEPEIENKRFRGGLLSGQRDKLGGFLYDGMTLFTPTKLSEEKTVVPTTSRKGDSYTITIHFVGAVSMNEWQALQVLNLIMRRAMSGLELQQVGRNFFDPVALINLKEFHLQLWPGYQTSIRQHENEILLCTEITHKVMRCETLYDILVRCTRNSRDYQEDFRREVIGLVVLTDYNNLTYLINDVDFNLSPEKTFDCKKRQISFMEYYAQKYQIHVRDPKQPLLLAKARDRAARDKSMEFVALIPELCRPTGLTDTMRSNFQLMRAMGEHTRMAPDRRLDRLRAFNQRLQKSSLSSQVFQDWQMKLDQRQVEVTGRVLEPQRIVFCNHKKISAGNRVDWTPAFRDSQMFTTPSRGLDRWFCIVPTRNVREMRNFIDAVIRAAHGMNFNITRPNEVVLYDDRSNSYIQAIEDSCNHDPQLIMCLVPNANFERYSVIKKKSCIERAIPSQVITAKSASNPRGLMSIATKVAIQLNSKLGYTPWMIDMPLSGLMTIGFDIVKSSRDRSRAYGALVATMDMKVNATFYSTVIECNANDMLGNCMWTMMVKALRQYRTEHNGELPTRIIFYRDGVGEGSLQDVYEHELQQIVANLEQEYKRQEPEKQPMFAYIVVSKSISYRFFSRNQNPPPGTVVDDVVTYPERFDFYLVSQSVRQGTVAPTSYNVIHSNIRLSPDQIQMLTYKMSHLYFNWSGTTRVPSVCQYAKKLATLVSTCLFQPPLQALEKKLYYL